jgi:KaiC/GvpD/RAD55 family RecA-like ATPase
MFVNSIRGQDTKSSRIKKLGRLHIFDYKDIIHEWKNEVPDLINATENVINFYRKKYDSFTVFALDSQNALYQASNEVNLRKNVYHFFRILRGNDLTSFLIMETCFFDMESPECSLADGIIELGTIRRKKNVNIYIQIKKWMQLIITSKVNDVRLFIHRVRNLCCKSQLNKCKASHIKRSDYLVLRG